MVADTTDASSPTAQALLCDLVDELDDLLRCIDALDANTVSLYHHGADMFVDTGLKHYNPFSTGLGIYVSEKNMPTSMCEQTASRLSRNVGCENLALGCGVADSVVRVEF